MDTYNKHDIQGKFVINHWDASHGRDWGVNYYLDVAGKTISLTDQQAEQVMLALGIGEVVYEVDPKDTKITPRIREFAGLRHFTTETEAAQALSEQYDREIEALQRKKNRAEAQVGAHRG